MSPSDYNNPVSLSFHQVLYALPLLQKNNIATLFPKMTTNMGAIAHRQKPLTLCGSALREQPQQLIASLPISCLGMILLFKPETYNLSRTRSIEYTRPN